MSSPPVKQDFHQKRTHAGSLLSPAGLATLSVSLVKTDDLASAGLSASDRSPVPAASPVSMASAHLRTAGSMGPAALPADFHCTAHDQGHLSISPPLDTGPHRTAAPWMKVCVEEEEGGHQVALKRCMRPGLLTDSVHRHSDLLKTLTSSVNSRV